MTSRVEPAEEKPAISPAPHECRGYLIFTDDDLAPHFALDAVVKDAGGSRTATFEYGGDGFEATLYYQQSGLAPRDDPDFRLETVREYRIDVVADDDLGERKANYHVAPRWPDMETTEGDPKETSDITGVSVHFEGSNLRLDAYPALLRRAADALDVNPGYFEGIHGYSNIYTYEEYVRIDRNKSEKFVGMNSPLRRIYELVGDAGEFRELREDDRGIEGYYHRVKFDSKGATALLSGHSLGKQIKHYHPKYARSTADGDDALAHPKVGVAYRSNLSDEGAVRWRDRDALRGEVEETLLNVLAWSGLPTRADGEAYVADAYFSVEESAREVRLVEDPTPEIRREQEAVVVEGITANPDLNQSDLETVEILSDGGRHVEEVAAETGYSRRTVYNVLDRLDDLLRNENGVVSLASEYLGGVVRDALADAKDALDRDEATAADDSAFVRWMNVYGVEVEDREDARLQLRFGRVSDADDIRDMKDILRSGLRAWTKTGYLGLINYC